MKNCANCKHLEYREFFKTNSIRIGRCELLDRYTFANSKCSEFKKYNREC